MEKIRCLIADMPQLILADIVYGITDDNQDIEVVDRVPAIEDVPMVLSEQDINVLILGMNSNLSFQYSRDIIKSFPDLLVIGFVDDGRLAAVYKGDVGRAEIIKIIQTLGKRKKLR